MKQIITLFLFVALGYSSSGQHLIGASARGWKGEAIYGLDYTYRWKINRLGVSLFYLENGYDYSNDLDNGAYLGAPYFSIFDRYTNVYTSSLIGRGVSLNYTAEIRSFGRREQFLVGWIISGSYLQIEDEYYFDYENNAYSSDNYHEYEGEFQYSALSCMTGVNLTYRVSEHFSVDGRVGVNYYFPVYNRDSRSSDGHIYTSDVQYTTTEFEVGLGVNFWVGRE